MAAEQRMGPQEKRLTSELAVYLVRTCSRALQSLAGRRRWFEQAYREWHLTPRVDLAGRSPYEVIAAERAAAHEAPPRQRLRPTIELYTDLPTFEVEATPAAATPDTPAARDADPAAAPSIDSADAAGWQRLADRLFGSWLDDKLDCL